MNRSSRTRTSLETDQSGNALLVVIGLVGILAALGVAYQATTQSQSRMLDALSARIAGQNAVDAVASLGIWRVSDKWRSNPETLEGAAWSCRQGDFAITLLIENESRRLNVNLADEVALAREISAAGVSVGRASLIAASIADYIDRDSLTASGLPEGAGYGAGSSPKNVPLDIIEEVRLAPGVSASEFTILEKTLSLYSTRTDRLPADLAGRTAQNPSPRGLYRITSIATAAAGAAPTFSRTVVLEYDPARPLSPAVRLWSPRPALAADLGVSAPPAGDCKDLLVQS